MKAKRSEFLDWFRAQFGKRASRKSQWQLRQELSNARHLAWRAQTVLDQCIRYDDWENAALKAWTASERART